MAVKNAILTLQLTEAADSNGIFTTKTPSGAGDLTLDGALISGGKAVFAEPRRVEAVFAADESAKTVIFTGKNRFLRPISESVTGAEIDTAERQ